MAQNLIKGSERKFTLKMEPIDGVHLADCKLKVGAFVSVSNVIPIDNSCVTVVDEDTLKVLIKKEVAEAIKSTNIKFRVEIGIPDSDFPDNYKDQIYDIIPDYEGQ